MRGASRGFGNFFAAAHEGGGVVFLVGLVTTLVAVSTCGFEA